MRSTPTQLEARAIDWHDESSCDIEFPYDENGTNDKEPRNEEEGDKALFSSEKGFEERNGSGVPLFDDQLDRLEVSRQNQAWGSFRSSGECMWSW